MTARGKLVARLTGAVAVAFLASDAARNIGGERLVVDAGCSAQHMPEDVDF